MSDLTYSVLKGRIRDAKPFSANRRKRPHFHILVEGGGSKFDVAVNIASEDPHVADVRVLFAVKTNIQPPHARELNADFRESPTFLFRTQLFPVKSAVFPRFLRLLRSPT